MLNQSKSALKVFLKETKQEKRVLAWHLSGYHGVEWSEAQVAWSGEEAVQVCEESFSILNMSIFILTLYLSDKRIAFYRNWGAALVKK